MLPLTAVLIDACTIGARAFPAAITQLMVLCEQVFLMMMFPEPATSDAAERARHAEELEPIEVDRDAVPPPRRS